MRLRYVVIVRARGRVVRTMQAAALSDLVSVVSIYRRSAGYSISVIDRETGDRVKVAS